jgi:hypothetical protein
MNGGAGVMRVVIAWLTSPQLNFITNVSRGEEMSRGNLHRKQTE